VDEEMRHAFRARYLFGVSAPRVPSGPQSGPEFHPELNMSSGRWPSTIQLRKSLRTLSSAEPRYENGGGPPSSNLSTQTFRMLFEVSYGVAGVMLQKTLHSFASPKNL